MRSEKMPQYEKPVVEAIDAEQLIEAVGAKAATTVSGIIRDPR